MVDLIINKKLTSLGKTTFHVHLKPQNEIALKEGKYTEDTISAWFPLLPEVPVTLLSKWALGCLK